MEPLDSNLPLCWNVFDYAEKLGLTGRQRAFVVPNLVEFLRSHSTPVGATLLGQTQAHWTKKDVRVLERLVVSDAPTVKDAEDFLLVLRKACRFRSLKLRKFLEFPRIPVKNPRVKVPFGSDIPKASQYFDGVKKTLASSIEEFARRSAEPSVADLVLSAILFGGLPSASLIAALVRAVPVLPQRLIAVDGRIHVELLVWWHGVANVELRRWQPDPLTATLLLRISPTAVEELLAPIEGKPCPDKELTRRIADLVEDHFRGSPGFDAKNLYARSIRVAQMIAYKNLPVLVAAYSSREFISHSFERGTLERFSKAHFEFLQPSPTHLIEEPRDVSPKQRTRLRAGAPETAYVQDLQVMFTAGDKSEIRERLRTKTATSVGFAHLMFDFADHMLAVPTKSGKLLPTKSVGTKVQLLAHHLGSLIEDAKLENVDINTISTEVLEPIYVQLLDGTGVNTLESKEARRLRFELASILRSFQEYLEVCHEKEPLSDRSILFCGETFSDVDSMMLSVEDFRTVLDKLDNDLVDVLSPNQRKVAQILTILGFRCGLRRLEALLCKVGDVLVDRKGKPIELLIRTSEGRGLKSRNARRRIPLGLIPEKDELEDDQLEKDELDKLAEWWRWRVKDQEATASEYLFAEVEKGLDAIPQTIFDVINSIIEDVAPNAHFHSLRHSAATILLTRLSLAGAAPLADFFPHLNKTSKLLSDGSTLHRFLYGHSKHTRKHGYKLAQVMGHGSVGVTLTSYMHMCDWIAAAYISQVPEMCADVDLVKKASGVKRSTRDEWVRHGGIRAVPLKMFEKMKAKAPVRPDAVRARHQDHKLGPSMTWIGQHWNLLRSAETWGRPLEEVARARSVDVALAKGMMARAGYLQSTGRHHLETWCPDLRNPEKEVEIACPTKATLPYDKQIVAKYEAAIAGLAANPNGSVKEVVQTALSSYVNRVWRYRNRVLFHNTGEAEEARNYVAFLKRLKIPLNSVGWYSFAPSQRSAGCVAWRRELKLEDYEIELVPPPNPDAESTEDWFGIMPKFQFDGISPEIENPGAYGFRFLMVMAFVAFGRIE